MSVVSSCGHWAPGKSAAAATGVGGAAGGGRRQSFSGAVPQPQPRSDGGAEGRVRAVPDAASAATSGTPGRVTAGSPDPSAASTGSPVRTPGRVVGSPLSAALPPPPRSPEVEVVLPQLPLPFRNNRNVQRQLRQLVLRDVRAALQPHMPRIKVRTVLCAPCERVRVSLC